MNSNTLSQVGNDASNLADQAADSANSALRSGQGMANQAFDRLSNKLDSAREKAVPMINRLSTQAEDAAHRGVDAVRDATAQVREKASQASDNTLAYIKDEPVKSMLIAAAAGAALMALVGLMSRSRHD